MVSVTVFTVRQSASGSHQSSAAHRLQQGWRCMATRSEHYFLYRNCFGWAGADHAWKYCAAVGLTSSHTSSCTKRARDNQLLLYAFSATHTTILLLLLLPYTTRPLQQGCPALFLPAGTLTPTGFHSNLSRAYLIQQLEISLKLVESSVPNYG